MSITECFEYQYRFDKDMLLFTIQFINWYSNGIKSIWRETIEIHSMRLCHCLKYGNSLCPKLSRQHFIVHSKWFHSHKSGYVVKECQKLSTNHIQSNAYVHLIKKELSLFFVPDLYMWNGSNNMVKIGNGLKKLLCGCDNKTNFDNNLRIWILRKRHILRGVPYSWVG